MKKLLLTLAVALMSLTAINAQVLGTTEWNKTLFTVANGADATDGVLAIDDNGNLFVSGALTTTATFGSFSVEPIGIASYIVKYDATGQVQWATAIQGAATIVAMDTDAAGNLYVAGQFADEIYVCNATNEDYTSLTSSNSTDKTAAFIAKYAADGSLFGAQACEATIDPEVDASFMYFGNPAQVLIKNIEVEGDNLYLSFTYNGDVTLGGYTLDAKYVFNSMGFGDYLDATSGAIIALNNSTFAPTALVANVSLMDGETNYGLNAINFTVDKGEVYFAVVGYGNMTVQTASTTQNVQFAMDGMGTNEYGMVVAKGGTIKVYNNIATSVYVSPYNVIENMDVVGENLYIVGTFRGYCPFDNTLSTLNNGTEISTSDIYVASVKTSDLSANWVVTTPDKNDIVNDEFESVVGTMIYPNEVRIVANIKKISGYSVISTSNPLVSFEGEVSALGTEQATAVAYNGNKAASVLSLQTLTALYYGTLPVTEVEGEEEIEVIYGEILKTNMWNSSISAVEQAGDAVVSSPSAIDAEGNLYVSGTMNKDFEFAEKTLSNLGIGTYVAKYDVQGNEKFAFAIYGAADITAMTTDAEGNLYVAASFTGEIYVTDVEGVDGDYQTMAGTEGDYFTSKPSSFLAKYDSNGNLVTLKTFIAMASAPIEYEYWGGVAAVSVNKIVAEGEKVYVQFSYNGDLDIDTIELNAKYTPYFGYACMDNKSFAVVSFDSNLVATANVAEVSVNTEDTNMPAVESFNFAVSGDDVYVAAIGYGSLIYKTAEKTENINFFLNGDNGESEHAAMVAKVGGDMLTTENIPNSAWASYYTISGMDIYAGKIFMAGTFNETCPFASSIYSVGSSDVYVTCYDAATLEQEWIKIDAKDEGATNTYYEEFVGMALYKGNVYVVADVVNMNTEVVEETLNYNVTANGDMAKGYVRPATAMAYSDDYAVLVNVDGTNTNVAFYSFEELVGIEESVVSESSNIKYINGVYFFAEQVDAAIYDVQGRCVKAAKAATEIATAGLNKGVYILKAGNEVVKFIK